MSRLAGFFVRFFEYAIPDPYIFAVGLTLITAILAFVFAPHHALGDVLAAWYKGIFEPGSLGFALQMILILVTGYALANSAPVARGLQWLAARPRTTKGAVSLTFVVSAIACWLNWGFGLVVAGLLAREIARRMRIDFGWLVAAAYSGFLIWASGISSSIALAQASPGNKLNIVQQITGHSLPIGSTIFTAFNLIPCAVLLVVLPFVFRALEPPDVVTGDVDALDPQPARRGEPLEARATLASALDNAWILNAIFAVAGLGYIVWTWLRGGFYLDINAVIFIFFCAGLLLHWTPVRYVQAVNGAARVTGPLIIQYPIYFGIMGIMTATGLAGVIAQWFEAFATAGTLPFWSYVSSILISLFVPSGGGHWAVQGPFAVPAAVKLHASLPATAMGVAIGEEVANMIQPFWALPVLAIAGVGLRRVMAFTVVSFVIAFVVFALSLLLLAR
ncbi:MAG TPA: TIGR00366 family protein [Candidatus Baltobacteraceae bacterium]|nr:TIGR00366 family protein [Candidatus Baltobacteraceae bacterium]